MFLASIACVPARSLVGFFAARTHLGIWLRNLGISAMNQRWLLSLIAGRSLHDDFELPDYSVRSK